MNIVLRRIGAVLAVLILLYLLLFRFLPRVLPWAGEENCNHLTWSLQIKDRHGEPLQVRPVTEGGLRRLWVPLGSYPDTVQRIVRLSEDRHFYFHPGFDPVSLARAGLRYRKDRQASGGGSTITMQLARILHPRPSGVDMTVALKLRETWEALQIESRFTKKEILELYLNLVPFGRNVEGYPAAAHLFFGKDVSELLPGEICLLTVIPRSPSLYDVLNDPESASAAAIRLADRIPGDKVPGPEDIEDIASRTAERGSPVPWPFEAPQFVERLLQDREAMTDEQRLGKAAVVSTLDLGMQNDAETLLKYHVELAENYRISNGSMLLADPESMEVLVYLGSADFNDSEAFGQIDGVGMLREPGSTLKPLLYASALDMGWTASTILPDIPTSFGNSQVYTPMNYNQQFHGPVRLRQALAASLNIPAVYTLERVGMDFFIDTLVKSGFQSLDSQRDLLGVSLAIGGGEVSLAELVQGYATLSNGGSFRPLKMIPGAEDAGVRVWTLESADIITDIISEYDDRVMTFGRSGPVKFSYPAAVKTGTSNQFNNIWAVGFTSDLIGGVWMGNFDGSTVIAAPGSSLPARVLHESFDRWSEKGNLRIRSELETRQICSVSGMIAGEDCPYTREELFAWGTAPERCDWHQRSSDGSVSVSFPQEFMVWAERYGYALNYDSQAPPGISNPVEGAVYYLDPSAPAGGNEIRIILTGQGVGTLSANGKPIFSGSLPAGVSWPLERGPVTLLLNQNNRQVVRRFEVR